MLSIGAGKVLEALGIDAMGLLKVTSSFRQGAKEGTDLPPIPRLCG